MKDDGRIHQVTTTFFFVVGLLILPFVNTDKAIADAKRDNSH
jgi:hypothetical protein